MGKHILKNCGLFIGETNLSAIGNKIAVRDKCKLLDSTTFGLDTEENTSGLTSVDISGTVFWDADTDGFDEDTRNRVGASSTSVITFVPETLEDPDSTADLFDAEFCDGLQATYELGGKVSDMHTATVNAVGSSQYIYGKILKYALVSAGGNGQVLQIGAVGADQYFYAAIHVTTATAVSDLDIEFHSDDAEAFTTGTKRAEVTGITDRGSWSITRVAGPITDDWWRAQWYLTGTSATILIVMGIK